MLARYGLRGLRVCGTVLLASIAATAITTTPFNATLDASSVTTPGDTPISTTVAAAVSAATCYTAITKFATFTPAVAAKVPLYE